MISMDGRGWTYGAEHEWADHPLSRPLPRGYGRDARDVTMVNSNGIANDPKGRTWRYGGEINTPPTDTLEGQVACLSELKAHLPEATINYRSNLHLHIRVPGLRDTLGRLKILQAHIHTHMRTALEVVEPLPRPERAACANVLEFQGALRRWRRRRISHQTLLTQKRLQGQLSATTTEEFFQRESPYSKAGKPLWHFQPRLCVNVRQLLETDTIEFRHFPGTMDECELRTSLEWCRDYLGRALTDDGIEDLLARYAQKRFPSFPPYIHWMEQRYRRTCHNHTLTRDEIEWNIKEILQEDSR